MEAARWACPPRRSSDVLDGASALKESAAGRLTIRCIDSAVLVYDLFRSLMVQPTAFDVDGRGLSREADTATQSAARRSRRRPVRVLSPAGVVV